MRPPERIEIPEMEDLRRERFARILAVLIVVATLGVASVEYLHSIADRSADAASVEAQRLSIERQGALVRAEDAARAQIDIYAYQQQERAQQANAFQEYLAPSVTSGSTQAQLLQLEENRWTTLAALTGDLTSIKAGGATSPQQDAAFPNQLQSQSEQDADRLFALEDAQNQQRGDWQGRAGFLSVILTMLAVAIYLFGLSLTLQARVRRWLVTLGVVLVAGGGVATVVLLFAAPAPVPDSAADSIRKACTRSTPSTRSRATRASKRRTTISARPFSSARVLPRRSCNAPGAIPAGIAAAPGRSGEHHHHRTAAGAGQRPTAGLRPRAARQAAAEQPGSQPPAAGRHAEPAEPLR